MPEGLLMPLMFIVGALGSIWVSFALGRALLMALPEWCMFFPAI